MNTENSTRHDLDALASWYRNPVGDALKSIVAGQLSRELAQLAVQDVLFLGAAGFENRLVSAKCERAMFFTDIACEHLLSNEDSYLPIKSESQECVVLLHGLDVAVNPQAVLREMSRTVARDGYLIIIGFNSISSWGLYRPFRRIFNWHTPHIPWQLRFHGLNRLSDWLELLGFETGKSRTMGFRPVIRSARVFYALRFLESIGNVLLPRFGNVYINIARKRTIPLTPEPLLSRLRAGLIKAGLPKTSTEGA